MKNTLKDLNVYLSDKQQGLVNTLVEKNPIIDSMPMKAASHGIYNVYGKVTEIDGMQEVDYDAELPIVSISHDLGRTRLGKIGGKLPMPMDAAKEMGGFDKFANERYPQIIAKSGNDNEARIYYKGFLASAIKNGNIISAGGSTSGKQYSMVMVHYDQDTTTGLYNPNALSDGKLFTTLMLNGGKIFELDLPDGSKPLGKMMAMFMEFGLQLADPDAVGAIVNIEPKANTQDPDKIAGLPSAMQIDDQLAKVRADIGSTFIYTHPAMMNYLANKYQLERRSVTNGETGVSYSLTSWNGVPIIGSYNILWGKEDVVETA